MIRGIRNLLQLTYITLLRILAMYEIKSFNITYQKSEGHFLLMVH